MADKKRVQELLNAKPDPKCFHTLCTSEHLYDLLRHASPLAQKPHHLSFCPEWRGLSSDASGKTRRSTAFKKLASTLALPNQYNHILIFGDDDFAMNMFNAIPGTYRTRVSFVWHQKPSQESSIMQALAARQAPPQHVELIQDTLLEKWLNFKTTS